MYARAKGIVAFQVEDARLRGRLPHDARRQAEVDAAIVALPPHWHALATIWRCQAGKDVYCEKPQSHNCWEGAQGGRGARKYNRIVQIGMQNAPPLQPRRLRVHRPGKLGEIHQVRVIDQKGEPNFPWRPTAIRPRVQLGHVERSGPRAQVQRDAAPPVAVLLPLLRRRFDLRRHSPGRPGPLAAA